MLLECSYKVIIDQGRDFRSKYCSRTQKPYRIKIINIASLGIG